MSMPMFGFFGLGFLCFATIVAIAIWLVVRSGEKGSTKLGGFAGCAIALALLVIAGLGALGCTTIALMNTPNEIVQRGPVKKFKLHWGEGIGVRLRFEIEGVDPGQVTNWIRENTEGEITYTITTREKEGKETVELDVSIPITEEELREFREEFHREFPDLRLPEGLEVELRREYDDR